MHNVSFFLLCPTSISSYCSLRLPRVILLFIFRFCRETHFFSDCCYSGRMAEKNQYVNGMEIKRPILTALRKRLVVWIQSANRTSNNAHLCVAMFKLRYMLSNLSEIAHRYSNKRIYCSIDQTF